ncbi:TetR/AcrR family transcriptional regulator [Paenibacillus sp. D51F]
MDKRERLIHHAMEQFMQKGYHQTTMQDIADAAGIAKGGIYFYFKSKEELIQSVFESYLERMSAMLTATAVRYEPGSRESLFQQIKTQLDELTSHSKMLLLFSSGQISLSEQMRELSMNARLRSFVWFRNQLVGVYGARIEPHAFDLTALATGLVSEYIGFILLNDVPLSSEKLARMIIGRLEDAVRGLEGSKEEPVLTSEAFRSFYPEGDFRNGTERGRLVEAAGALARRLEPELAGQAGSDARHAAAMLVEEAAAPVPRPIVLDGMLALLQAVEGLSGWPETAAVRAALAAWKDASSPAPDSPETP